MRPPSSDREDTSRGLVLQSSSSKCIGRLEASVRHKVTQYRQHRGEGGPGGNCWKETRGRPDPSSMSPTPNAMCLTSFQLLLLHVASVETLLHGRRAMLYERAWPKVPPDLLLVDPVGGCTTYVTNNVSFFFFSPCGMWTGRREKTGYLLSEGPG